MSAVTPLPFTGESADAYARRVMLCWASGACRPEHAVTRAIRVGPKRWKAAGCLEFKPEDCWIGAFWRRSDRIAGHHPYDLWICLIPCLPVHIWWYRKDQP